VTRVKWTLKFFIALWGWRMCEGLGLSRYPSALVDQIALNPSRFRTLSSGLGMPERYSVTKSSASRALTANRVELVDHEGEKCRAARIERGLSPRTTGAALAFADLIGAYSYRA